MKVKVIPYSEALVTLKAADKALQEAKTPGDKRKAALDFATAERNAISARKRETEGKAGASLLDSLPADKAAKQ